MEKSEKKSEEDKKPPDKVAVEVAAPEKKRTWGNIIYDFGVFGSIAWAGVAALSAVSAHESKYGKNKAFGWLRTLNDKAFSGLKKAFTHIAPKGSNPKTIEGFAEGTTMFLTLGMGGNALMAPIKWLEDHRQRNAAKIDEFLGTTPPDSDTIAHEPHQTWKSVFSGRLLSWGGSYAAFLAMGPALTGKLSKGAGEYSTKLWMKFRPDHNRQNVRKWADIIAFDALFTVITASATYLFSRAIAKKDDGKIHDFEEALYEAQVAAPTMLEPIFHKEDTAPEKPLAHEGLKRPRAKVEPSPATFTEKYNAAEATAAPMVLA